MLGTFRAGTFLLIRYFFHFGTTGLEYIAYFTFHVAFASLKLTIVLRISICMALENNKGDLKNLSNNTGIVLDKKNSFPHLVIVDHLVAADF